MIKHASKIINEIYVGGESAYPTLQEILLQLGQEPSAIQNQNKGTKAPKRLTNNRKQKSMLK